MEFSLSPEQERIREAVAKVCERFGDDYWLKKDREGGFPADFHQAFARDGWLGIAMPEAYGGSGLGITEAAVMMPAIAASGSSASSHGIGIQMWVHAHSAARPTVPMPSPAIAPFTTGLRPPARANTASTISASTM
jgi:alkylation response protein AidB-like acyl-CoA dehydrogenase